MGLEQRQRTGTQTYLGRRRGRGPRGRSVIGHAGRFGSKVGLCRVVVEVKVERQVGLDSRCNDDSLVW